MRNITWIAVALCAGGLAGCYDQGFAIRHDSRPCRIASGSDTRVDVRLVPQAT